MAAKRTSKAQQPTFEQRLEALEGVVRDLEGEELPLETSLGRYREGVEHLRACRALLDDAEARLAELVGEDDAGAAIESPLRIGADGLEAAGADDDAHSPADGG